MMTKHCKACKETLPINEFYEYSRNKDGLYSYCKPCTKSRKKISRDKHYDSDKQRQYKKTYRSKHPERLKEQHRKQNLRRAFNLTIEEYDELFIKQEGKCTICETIPSHRRLAVDHCHTTGIVRGLLCSNCNTALGLLKDDPQRIERLLNYSMRN